MNRLLRLAILCALTLTVSARWTDSLRNATSAVTNRTASFFSGRRRDVPPEPPFCHKRACPAFETLNNSTVYSIREYWPATWVTDQLDSSTFQSAMAKGALPLHSYFKGQNDQNATFPTSSPLAVSITTTGNYSAMNNTFTIGLFLRDATKKTAPRPTSSNLGVSSTPEGQVYVYSFGGFASTKSVLNSAKKLAAALDQDGLLYVPNSFIFALYDGPTRFLRRHNEIWFMPASGNTVSLQAPVTAAASSTTST